MSPHDATSLIPRAILFGNPDKNGTGVYHWICR